jgi:hypothetical protein
VTTQERRKGGRRESDQAQQSIEDILMPAAQQLEKEILGWIETANDTQDKALLMILYRMNASLTENTKFTKDIAEDFTSHKHVFGGHITRVEKMLNMVRGGYLVALAAGVVVQALIGFIVWYSVKMVEREIDVNGVQEQRITKIEGRLDALDHEVWKR